MNTAPYSTPQPAPHLASTPTPLLPLTTLNPHLTSSLHPSPFPAPCPPQVMMAADVEWDEALRALREQEGNVVEAIGSLTRQ